jgi:kumamolisin
MKPDVGGNADITSGFITLVHGQWGPVGGTSAVAPLYAGLVALLNADLDHPIGGTLLPTLYALNAAEAAAVFGPVTGGDNSVPKSQFGPAVDGYSAGAKWDACTGLGSIRGAALLSKLQGSGTASARFRQRARTTAEAAGG